MGADALAFLALLTAISHDVRSPLAAAKAAIGGLRSRDTRPRRPVPG
jgi:K+-sensing histidine kinase KdpD